MISPQTIEKVKETARIEEVVGERIELRRRGSGYVACCPFHNEKTPSFSVTPARNTYKCFGCGVGGGALNFVMEFDKLTYPEAVRKLAERYHIPIEETKMSAEDKQRQDDRVSINKLVQFCLSWCQDQLADPQIGLEAKKLLMLEWGIREDIINAFALAFCPNHEDMLQAAKDNGYQEKFIELSGLSSVDFSNAIIVPIFSISGTLDTIGALPIERPAKMLGLPQTVYNKPEKMLYAIDKAARSKSKSIIWVKHAIDAIWLHQAGIDNVVATPLTKISSQNINTLARFSNELILTCPAHLMSNELWVDRCAWLLAQGVMVSVLPIGEEDATLQRLTARVGTGDNLSNYIRTHKLDFMQHMVKSVLGIPENEPQKRLEKLKLCLRIIKKIPDDVIKNRYMQFAGELLNIPPQMLNKL